jgi:hypothetical protein
MVRVESVTTTVGVSGSMAIHPRTSAAAAADEHRGRGQTDLSSGTVFVAGPEGFSKIGANTGAESSVIIGDVN